MSSPAWKRRRGRARLLKLIRNQERLVRRSEHRMHELTPFARLFIQSVAEDLEDFKRDRLTR